MGRITITSLYNPDGSMVQRSSTPDMPEAFRERVVRIQAGDPDVRVEDRGAEGVFLVEVLRPTGPDGKPREVIAESRLDSRQDAEVRRAGGAPWWERLAKPAKVKK